MDKKQIAQVNEELANLQRFDATFLKSLTDVINPAILKLARLHNSMVFEKNEENSLNLSVKVLNHYLDMMIKQSNNPLVRSEKAIAEGIKREINDINAIITGLRTRNLDGALVSCSNLKNDLIKLNEYIKQIQDHLVKTGTLK